MLSITVAEFKHWNIVCSTQSEKYVYKESSNLVLEVCYPAEFSSNPNQTQLPFHFLGVWLRLNSAGQWTSRSRFEEPLSTLMFQKSWLVTSSSKSQNTRRAFERVSHLLTMTYSLTALLFYRWKTLFQTSQGQKWSSQGASRVLQSQPAQDLSEE